MEPPYDALIVVAHGGPENSDEVVPFLENVVEGKNVPHKRLLQIAERYQLFGGVSPANASIRALLAALIAELNKHGPHLAVYWGNRYWHPLLPDVLRQMADDGIRRALALVTSAFGSYSGCRQYLEDIQRARQQVGQKARYTIQKVPQVDKLRLFYNHPGFVEPISQLAANTIDELPEDRRKAAKVVFTAHAIPLAMADKCTYRQQLQEACRLVADRLPNPDWDLVYQSRSGPPSQQWLGPDVADYLRGLAEEGQFSDVVLVPIGFLYEHMETVFDLDVQVADLCQELGLNMLRSPVLGTHPRFLAMIRELIVERTQDKPNRPALGSHGPSHDVCPPDCCPRE